MAYIGKSPSGTGVRQRYYFTATGGETSLSGTDDNGKALTFTDGEYVDVHLNGIQLVQGTDYGVGTANTIDSLSALAADDVVEVTVHDVFNFAKLNSEAIRHRWYYTATGSETSITTTEVSGLKFPASAEIDVKLNGISLVQGTDFNTTTANTVGGLAALSAGNVVEIVYYEPFQLADVVSKAAGGTYNGDVTFNGNINAGTIKDATGTNTGITIDSSGRVLTPARPAFSVYQSTALSAADYTSTDFVVPFDTEDFDIGSNVAVGSSAVFTAPVAGVYQFNLTVILGTPTAANWVSSFLFIDGARVSSDSDLSYRVLIDAVGGDYVSLASSHLIQLTASQTVTPYFRVNGDTSTTVRKGGRFSGFLVG